LFWFLLFLEFEIEEREVGKKQNTEIFEDVDRTDWRKKIAKRGEAEKVPNLFFLRKNLILISKRFFKVSKYCSYIF
jgi:hypothetical protein